MYVCLLKGFVMRIMCFSEYSRLHSVFQYAVINLLLDSRTTHLGQHSAVILLFIFHISLHLICNIYLSSQRMFCFRKEAAWPKDFIPTLLLCGLDNAGKSTIVCRIRGDNSEPTPTVGFNPSTVKIANKNIRFYDVGGGERIRGIWGSYYAEVYGVIYVIDSTDITRLSENVEIFQSLGIDDHLLRKPILVLANKQDTTGALNTEQLAAKLSLSAENVHITQCAAINHGLDKNIKTGIAWILNYINDNYEELSHKVTGDLAAIDESRKKERAARQERIRIAKEERELEEGNAPKPDKAEESEEDDMVCSPFKPIKNAFSDSNVSQEVLSSPDLTPQSSKKQKKIKKKRKKGNKITPFHSNEGSQKSLISNESTETLPAVVNKLTPLSSKTALPTVASEIVGLDKSSLPPIQFNNKSDSQLANKTKLEDLVASNPEPEADNSVSLPGIFQNKYVAVDNVPEKPSLEMKSLHTIRVDRSVFNKNISIY